MRLRVLTGAEDDLVQGAFWYDERLPDLGDRFVDEYEQTIRRILAAPRSYGRLESVRSRREIRRCFLQSFPYYIPYEVIGDEIVVLAVAHASRKPSYWLRRR
jgi:plasmid stabilization system protein ParE